MPTIHFLAGLPRSGSTLLMNILAQNPDIHPTTTSPLPEALVRARNSWQDIGAYSANPDHRARDGALKGLLQGYYAHVEEPVVIDKHRGWPSHIELLEHLTQCDVKIICTVRCIVDILSSMEKLYRANKAVRRPEGEGQAAGQYLSVKGRANVWMGEVGVIGSAYLNMQDACARGYRDRLHFVEYGNLTKFPDKTLKKVYKFLGMEPYDSHDFVNVEQTTQENDYFHGFEDLHTIRPTVAHQHSDATEVLGEELVALYSKPGAQFWRAPGF